MAARDLSAIVRAKDEASKEFNRIAAEVDKFSGGLLKVPAAGAAAAVGIGAVALVAQQGVAKALALGEAFDEAMDSIRISTGASDDQMVQFGQHLDNLVLRSVPTDMAPAGEALGELSRRLGATGEGLEKLAAQELELSRLTKTGLSENIRETSRLMQSWRVDTDEQSNTLDKLFVAAQQTGSSVGKLSEGVTGAGASLRGLGFSLDQSIALLGQMEKEGANAELASRGLKAALSTLTAAGLDAPLAFREYVSAIRDASSETDALTLATALFGSRGAAELSDAIRRGVFDVDALTGKMQGAGGAILDTSEKTKDAAERWKDASNQMAVAFRPVGEAALGAAGHVAGAMAQMVRAVADDGQTIRKELADLEKSMALAEAARRGEFPPKPELTMQIPKGLKLSRNFAEEFRNSEAAAKAAVSKLAELMAKQFDTELTRGLRSLDLAQRFGTEGGRVADEFMAPFGDEKWGTNVGKAVDDLIGAMTREGVPGAAQLGQDIRDAINEGISGGKDEAAAAVLARINSANAALQFKRDEPERKRVADEIARDAKAAVAEAKRIAEEWKRTMPITGENFAAELQRAAAAASQGVGRGIFEGLTKAIEDGGESNIAAVGKLAADMAQKMRDEFGPEDGAAWANELTERVNRAIVDRTPGSIAAVGEWVKAFDVESQLRVAGDRAAIAINEATDQAERSILEAQRTAEERIARIRADAKMAADRETERGGLQKALDTGLEAFRDTQGGTSRALQNAREEADIATRRAREDADLAAKSLKDKDRSAAEEKKLLEAVNEARFRGDSIAVNRAQKAIEDRKKGAKDQADDELKALALRRQREDDDFRIRRARQADDLAQTKIDAADLQAERDRLFESSGMKGFIDRIKGEDLDRTIRDVVKGLEDTTATINENLQNFQDKTNAGMDTLIEKLRGARDVSDTMFTGALEQASRLAALFGPGGFGFGGEPTPGQSGTGGNTVTIGTLNATNNGVMGEGGPEALAAQMVAAEESLLQ